jgi:tetratricopeptide (TPR) repeat protein
VAQVAHQVPVVVWVLNAESATTETMTVLDEICDGGGRLLVVAIANSRDRRSAMWRTFSERFDRRHRVGTVGCSHTVTTQACDGASDLATQVRGVLPTASEPVLAEVVGSVDSFGALRRLLGTPRVRDPEVTTDDVRTAAMARQRDLVPVDDGRRRLLAAAATLGPSFLAVTLSMAEIATAEEVDALAGVDGLGRWVAPVAPGWYRFTSRGAQTAAADLAEATLSRRDRAALGDAALRVLERARMGDDPGRLLVAAASVHAVGGQGDAAHGDGRRSDETAALWAAAVRLSEFGRWSGAARVGGWCEGTSSERRSLVAYWRSLGGAEGGPSDTDSVDPAVRIGAGLARLAAMSASSAGTSTAAKRAIDEVAGALAEIGAEVDGRLLADWQLALADVLVNFGEGERAADLLDRVRPVSVRQRVILDDLGAALEHSYVGLHRRISLLTTALDELRSDNRGTETEIELRRELGLLLHQDGRYAEAVAELRQVAVWCESAVGERHPDTLKARANLAVSLLALGDAAGAADLEREVLADLVDVLGERHPDTLIARANLAANLGALGDAAGAAELERQVLADRVDVLGERHPDTLRARANLAASLWALGDVAGAAELKREVLADRVVVLGERHPDTLVARANLAWSLSALGDAAGAAEIERQVLADRVVVLGERHPDTLTSMNNLAWSLWHLGERGDAVELMRAAVEGREEVLPDHPDTASSRAALEGWLAQT